MKTVKEVSRLTGVSIRTLHYYDSIGLLRPASVTDAGYRLYDDAALERLQYIMLFRELEFSLKETAAILNSSDFSREEALRQQIELLELKKEHLDNLITFARELKLSEGNKLEFKAFDTSKIDAYAAQAKEKWGGTKEYKEYAEKSKGRNGKAESAVNDALMSIFAELGAMKAQKPDCEEVQQQVKKLRSYISEYYYDCTPEMLGMLGEMYAGGGEMTENIDAAGGKGTGEFAKRAIDAYCGK